MKKIFVNFLFVLICCLFTVPCFAKVNPADFQIAGLKLGDTVKDLYRAYGKPLYCKPAGDDYQLCYYSMNGCTVYFRIYNNKIVEGIFSTDDTGLGTEGGISYGSTIENVKNAYGEPNYAGLDENLDSPFYKKFGYDYSCNDDNYQYILRFTIENDKVTGFYLNRYPILG